MVDELQTTGRVQDVSAQLTPENLLLRRLALVDHAIYYLSERSSGEMTELLAALQVLHDQMDAYRTAEGLEQKSTALTYLASAAQALANARPPPPPF